MPTHNFNHFTGKKKSFLTLKRKKKIKQKRVHQKLIEVTRVEKATNDLKAEYFIYTNRSYKKFVERRREI